MKQAVRYSLLAAMCLALCAPVSAYNANGRWITTASGSVGPLGTPVILTWSIVPDGTNIQDLGGNFHDSELIASLDSWFGSGPGGTDYTQRPWFTRFEQCFDRWEQLGGVTFAYQPADDGISHGSLQGNNQRGDIRFGGTDLGGPGGTYGSSWFIPNADITLDTTDQSHFTNTSGNYRNFRNTVTHEIGHAIGLGHINSTNASFLMESGFSSAYDGPQFDDIRGIQYQYGDVFEKTNNGAGNGTIANAYDLQTLMVGSQLVVGADGTTGTDVFASEDEFVSVSNSNDLDFYSFNISSPSLVDLVLTPVGPSYSQQGVGTINSASASNLALELYAVVEGSPSLLASANANPIGMSESILDFTFEEPGEYYVRISGSSADVQMYTLSLTAEELDLSQPGDFDGDGDVDGRDLLIWQRGESPDSLSFEDLSDWRNNYGTVPPVTAISVPEPSATALVSMICAFASITRRKRVI